ncbi:MAG: 2-amino-4-hydroxy-6-hydroxymethyldihydropteridine diphosphokinase [Candidatus Omnitrophota bacterium]
MKAACYLGIGSNLGDRRKNIRMAIKEINALEGTKVTKISCLMETVPVGGPCGQPKFLNAALKIKTGIPPFQLLKKLKQIEKKLGRRRTLPNGPRPIDLDILFYQDRIIHTKTLHVPHPRMFERAFVLKPLSEVI